MKGCMLLRAVWCSGDSEAPGSISISYRPFCLALFVEVLSSQTAEGEVASWNRPRHPLSTHVAVCSHLSTLFDALNLESWKYPISHSVSNQSVDQPIDQSVNLQYFQIWTVECVYTYLSEMLLDLNIFNVSLYRLVWYGKTNVRHKQ